MPPALYDSYAAQMYRYFNYSLQQIPCNTTSSAQVFAGPRLRRLRPRLQAVALRRHHPALRRLFQPGDVAQAAQPRYKRRYPAHRTISRSDLWRVWMTGKKEARPLGSKNEYDADGRPILKPVTVAMVRLPSAEKGISGMRRSLSD